MATAAEESRRQIALRWNNIGKASPLPALRKLGKPLDDKPLVLLTDSANQRKYKKAWNLRRTPGERTLPNVRQPVSEEDSACGRKTPMRNTGSRGMNRSTGQILVIFAALMVSASSTLVEGTVEQQKTAGMAVPATSPAEPEAGSMVSFQAAPAA